MKKNSSERGHDSSRDYRPRIPMSKEEKETNISAFEDAMHDIEQDPDLSAHSPNDDLDEGESARLGEDRTDLV